VKVIFLSCDPEFFPAADQSYQLLMGSLYFKNFGFGLGVGKWEKGLSTTLELKHLYFGKPPKNYLTLDLIEDWSNL